MRDLCLLDSPIVCTQHRCTLYMCIYTCISVHCYCSVSGEIIKFAYCVCSNGTYYDNNQFSLLRYFLAEVIIIILLYCLHGCCLLEGLLEVEYGLFTRLLDILQHIHIPSIGDCEHVESCTGDLQCSLS